MNCSMRRAAPAGQAKAPRGLCSLVPSHVIGFDQTKYLISRDWMDLQAIFEQSDQCLIIDDPIAAPLDVIHAGITHSGAGAYLLGRLPVSVTAGEPDPSGSDAQAILCGLSPEAGRRRGLDLLDGSKPRLRRVRPPLKKGSGGSGRGGSRHGAIHVFML